MTWINMLMLVGTSRASLPATLLEGELAATARAAIDLPGLAPERRLWLAAGAADLYARAGHVPPLAATVMPVPSTPEQLPPCPVPAESFLRRTLEGGYPPSLLGEWLVLLASQPARLPERFLPDLLELATRQPALRSRLLPVLGTRGAWLAALEPAWAWAGAGSAAAAAAAAAEQLQRAWHEGTLEQRIAALEAWRREDPAAARAALESCWPTEPPDNRTALLPCLGIGLAAADEDFLETALGDRRKGVRQAAQRLLARLPGSRLSQRMLARVAPLLHIEKRLLRGARLAVALPAERDAAMIRDGVGETAHPGLGEKAGWLVDMLATIAPSHWSTALDRSPDECFALAAGTDYAEALRRGWTGALLLHLAPEPTPGSLAWLEAWTRAWQASANAERHQQTPALVAACAGLPAPTRHANLLEFVEASRTPWQADDAPLVELLHQLAAGAPAPWPAPLSHAIARRLLAALPTLGVRQWSFRAALPAFAAVLDPATVVAAQQQWPGLADDPHGWQGPLDQFFDLVRFRHEMIRSFQETA